MILKKKYRNQILNRIKASSLINERVIDAIMLNPNSAWSVIGEENSYHTIHCHSDGKFNGISTLVYLKVPRTNCKDESENNIYLATSIRPKNPFYYENSNCLEINPEVGKLLIFPNWVLHGTYPQTRGIRQTFNVDYEFLFENKKNDMKKINYN